MLQQMNTQHPLERYPGPALAGFRVVRLDAVDQPLPGNDGIHLFKKALLAGLFYGASSSGHRSGRVVSWWQVPG